MSNLHHEKQITNKKGSLANYITADVIDYLSKQIA